MTTEKFAKLWAVNEGLVREKRYCSLHNQIVPAHNGPLFGILQYRGSNRGRKFDHQSAVATDTWFERVHCDFRPRITITHCFAQGFSFHQTTNEASILDTIVSSETVSDVFSY